MNCERVRELCPDYLAGEAPAGVNQELREHLRQCPSCQEEFDNCKGIWEQLSALPRVDPSPELDARVQALITSTRRRLDREQEAPGALSRLAGFLESLWPRRPAFQFALASLCFILGIVLGPSLFRQATRPQNNQADTAALAGLREEVSGLTRMVTLALLQQSSASERLRGVDWSSRLSAPDDQVLSALLKALDSDPNVNVRLAAVQALEQYGSSQMVRQGLLASLPRQQSPLVQIELIRLLVELRDKDSLPVLKALVDDQAINPTVRQSAEWGLAQFQA